VEGFELLILGLLVVCPTIVLPIFKKGILKAGIYQKLISLNSPKHLLYNMYKNAGIRRINMKG
jgi:hypothetical protein